ncbi:MAG: response regulator, partial [Deltaproteobacteria bacterium]|nr:response regulator [Deltaproteobacteria bacterium]
DVHVASSAPDALAMIERDTFDAILCDVMMPGMTGPDLHASLASRDEELANRVVFMTGGAFLPRIAESLAALPNPKLEKPIDLDALEGAVQAVIRRTRRQGGAGPSARP